MKALGALALVAVLLVTGCGPDEDCCAPDPTRSPAPSSPAATAPSESADLAATAAQTFVAYAEGGRPDVPWADIVRFTVRGDRVAELDPAAADRRRSWRGCPDGASTYEGRDCPVSALLTIAEQDTVLEREAPRIIGCNRYTPPRSDAATTVLLRPDEGHRDCFTDFAIAVGVDPDGSIVAVDLALSGP